MYTITLKRTERKTKNRSNKVARMNERGVENVIKSN